MTEAGRPGGSGRFSDAVDALPCGILSFEDDGSIRFVNATLCAMLGYDRGELDGRHVETVLTVPGRIFFQTHLFPLVRLRGRADELFVLLRHRNGRDVGALLNAVRHDREEGSVTDCVLIELRERRKYEDALLAAKQAAEAATAALAQRTRELESANEQLEQQALELELQHRALEEQAAELERARAAAEEANRAKSRFLAVVSHELRTPLNAIGGYVQLIEIGVHGPVTDGQREALSRITRGQRRLLGLIDDLLNLARIEAGRIEYVRERGEVSAVVASVLPMIEPQMAAAGLHSTVAIADGLEMEADPQKVQQILINLLTNAVKFTPSGGRITVAGEADPTHDRVLVHVTDSGIGIAPEELEVIFEPFVRVDLGHAHRKEGTGLGLAISRELARGMGGDLFVRSTPGRGSTFTLALPQGGEASRVEHGSASSSAVTP